MRKSREVMDRRYIPDPEIVEQMRTKIEQVVKNTSFNVSYIDAAKCEMWGSYENFIRIRIRGVITIYRKQEWQFFVRVYEMG